VDRDGIMVVRLWDDWSRMSSTGSTLPVWLCREVA